MESQLSQLSRILKSEEKCTKIFNETDISIANIGKRKLYKIVTSLYFVHYNNYRDQILQTILIH